MTFEILRLIRSLNQSNNSNTDFSEKISQLELVHQQYKKKLDELESELFTLRQLCYQLKNQNKELKELLLMAVNQQLSDV